MDRTDWKPAAVSYTCDVKITFTIFRYEGMNNNRCKSTASAENEIDDTINNNYPRCHFYYQFNE